MLGSLFRRLTARDQAGAALFDTLTREARRPHWYVEGAVPDTLDGRFAVLATVTALALVRLEPDGEAGDSLSVAVTERFIAVMESEHRELGQSDPTLGKTVRRLVGMLSRRTDLWRSVLPGTGAWDDAARDSLYKESASPAAVAHSAKALAELADRLGACTLSDLEQGKIP